MKRPILALAAFMLLAACSKNDHGDTNLHITGYVKGLKQGRLYIRKMVDTSLVSIDTIVINGKSAFESHLKIDSPEMFYLILDRGQTNSVDNSLLFFAEPGDMKIETSNDQFFARAKVTGSENQKLYDDFTKLKSRFTGQNLELVKRNLEATKSGNVALLDSVQKASDELMKRRYLFTVNFALNNVNHDIAPYLALSEIYDANVKYLDTIRKSMPKKVAQSHYGKMLTRFVADRKKEEQDHNQ